ncbi:MAG TPA: PepSY-like domain-containing protein [Thermoanaerobaculia bacterium]|nr:PepSY-like domain-containing protein [Thermoanaerobaculia bacterium]
MSSRIAFTLAFALLLAPGLAVAKTDCPAAVTDAAQKAYPAAKVTACKQEKEKGKVQYEVKLETQEAKKLELDISPEGSILLTEEAVAVDSVPKSVMAAFEAKYPKMKAAKADKQTQADGTVGYEIAFKDAKGKKHEATFKEDGTFVEEE